MGRGVQDSDWPLPGAFYFSIIIKEFGDSESSFQEVSGLKGFSGIVEKTAGEENDFVHRLPSPPKYENLVLKRCLMADPKLLKWCRDALELGSFRPKDIDLMLLNDNGKVLASWNIQHAFPIKWELSMLKETSNKLAIESLTMNYRFFKKVF